MKTILPWLCVAALGVGLAFLYMSNQKQAAELTQLRADSQELQDLRAAAEEAKKSGSESENAELARLRQDNKDLLRLRAEVANLRKEKDQLGKQAQSAEAKAQAVQQQVQAAQAAQAAQAQAAQTQSAQAQAALQRLNAARAGQGTPEEQAAMRARYGLAPAPGTPLTPEQQLVSTCQNNLRQIDGAKQQWALEQKKTADAAPNSADISPYLAGNKLPVCPAGGGYTINAVNAKPTCSIAGHVLP